MPDIKELILAIVRPLVSKPEEVSVQVSESDEFMEYALHVNPEDVGRVIGKQGRVARSIRTIVYSVRTEGKRVRLSIEDGDRSVEE